MSIDTILGIIGTVLGIIGIVTGYIFYKKSLRQKLPFYSISSNNLIQDNVANMSGLEILFKGHTIKNLTTSKILFWNNGNDTIDGNDIVTANPLRIECIDGNNILDANVLSTNNQPSQLHVQIEKNGVYATITFDYLDKKQGSIIQIVHTGKSSKDIAIKGDIKGAKLNEHISKYKLTSWLTSVIFTVLAISLAAAFYFLTNGLENIWRLGITALIFIVFFFGSIPFSIRMDENLSNQYPSEFKKFGE